MADLVKVKMLRGVGGFEEGATRELSAADAKRLSDRGLVQISGKSAGAAPQNKMAQEPEDKSLSSMTKAELIDTANAEGVAIETDDNKADLVRKIEKARK